MKIPKLKNKGFSIPLEIYPYTVFVSFGDAKNFIQLFKEDRYMNKITDDEIKEILSHFNEDNEYAALTLPLNSGNVLIHFYLKNQDNYLFNTISHESLHTVRMIMDRVGMKLNSKNDEAFCYLLGYIVEKIIEEI